MSNKIKKLRAQIKSNAYYIFWGVATVAVIAGQVYWNWLSFDDSKSN